VLTAATVALAAGASLAVVISACDTVSLWDPPADINACRPSQQFFIDAIWPMFLNQDYGGVHCYDSQCHGVASTNQLRLTVPTGPGSLPLPADWAANYRAVAGSKLLQMPSGQKTHRGGMLISPTGPEADLIKMWVSAP
jgi:hypothetical protein